jgi:hypothetical protein
MKTFILILFLLGNNTGTSSQHSAFTVAEFTSHKRCEVASVQIREKISDSNLTAVCVEK